MRPSLERYSEIRSPETGQPVARKRAANDSPCMSAVAHRVAARPETRGACPAIRLLQTGCGTRGRALLHVAVAYGTDRRALSCAAEHRCNSASGFSGSLGVARGLPTLLPWLHRDLRHHLHGIELALFDRPLMAFVLILSLLRRAAPRRWIGEQELDGAGAPSTTRTSSVRDALQMRLRLQWVRKRLRVFQSRDCFHALGGNHVHDGETQCQRQCDA
jgi:hypothetical protein